MFSYWPFQQSSWREIALTWSLCPAPDSRQSPWWNSRCPLDLCAEKHNTSWDNQFWQSEAFTCMLVTRLWWLRTPAKCVFQSLEDIMHVCVCVFKIQEKLLQSRKGMFYRQHNVGTSPSSHLLASTIRSAEMVNQMWRVRLRAILSRMIPAIWKWK